MNYSAVALVMLVAYLWHNNSLFHEIELIKKILVNTYEMIETKFGSITEQMNMFQADIMALLDTLQNNTLHTIDLIKNNSKKIDTLDGKIDLILNKHT